MRRTFLTFFLLVFLTSALSSLCGGFGSSANQGSEIIQPRAYLGYDLNEYPGDDALPVLRKTFSFSSYWLGPPPGEKQTTWKGKRALLKAQGFGFVVLFNGRDSRNLRNVAEARQKGTLDAQTATKSAEREGFPKGTIIFLDIEEGGRLPPNYHEYIKSSIEGLQHDGYRAGVYCSGIPVSEGKGVSVTTAQDIQDHAGTNEIAFWVYNDACPPSPGCTFPLEAPSPQQSGIPSAAIWQYAQSPRRKQFTAQCPANYAADGNCYAPVDILHKWFLDVNTATSADPSSAK
jgi:hypothetical protein